jgi:AraC-like DNA-binding protein
MRRLHRPAPPLDAFLRCFWYWKSEPLAAPPSHTRERLLPTGEASLIFNLLDEEMRLYDAGDPQRFQSCGLAGLTGARTRSIAIDTASEDCVVGIQFHPGGTFPFFPMPAGELAHQSLPLEDLWGPAAGEIREQLLAAPSPDAMFALLERTLLAQLVRPLELHPAVRFARAHICRAPQVATVSGVMDRIGLSQRRFIDLFRDQVGLAPKAFCRVRRFQRVLQAVHRRNAVDWAQVALDGGYYDQAHLIHDFQAFSGLTPAAYLDQATEHLNHVPMA